MKVLNRQKFVLGRAVIGLLAVNRIELAFRGEIDEKKDIPLQTAICLLFIYFANALFLLSFPVPSSFCGSSAAAYCPPAFAYSTASTVLR